MKLFLDRLVDFASVEGMWISNTLIYNSDGIIIGKFDLRHHGEHDVFINLIAFHEEYRNRGYFRQLLDLICRVADMNKDTIQLIPLPTETDSIKDSGITLDKLKSIYSSYGFTPDIEDAKVTTYTRTPK